MVELKGMYAIYLKKQNSKQKDRIFIVVGKYTLSTSYVSCIGFWTEKVSEENEEIDKNKLEEIYIPWSNIDCVRSLLYRPKF